MGMQGAQTLDYQVRLALGEFAEDYDIPAIVTALRAEYPGLSDIDDVPNDAFWSLATAHDTTTGERVTVLPVGVYDSRVGFDYEANPPF